MDIPRILGRVCQETGLRTKYVFHSITQMEGAGVDDCKISQGYRNKQSDPDNSVLRRRLGGFAPLLLPCYEF